MAVRTETFRAFDNRLPGAAGLDSIKEKTQTIHVPADPDHFGEHKFNWDLIASTKVYARDNRPEDARTQYIELLKMQDPRTGFVPNMEFGRGRKFDPERWLVFGPKAKISTYSQPAIQASGLLETFYSFVEAGKEDEGRDLVRQAYEQTASIYRYFMNTREGEHGNLIMNSHPHEDGMDGATFKDKFRIRVDVSKYGIDPKTLPSSLRKTIARINTLTHYVSTIGLGIRLRAGGWKPENFGVYDVLFNALYARNLRIMSGIANLVGEKRDEEFFYQKAEAVGRDIAERLWDEQDEVFYSKHHGETIKAETISSLGGLLIPEAYPEQIDKMIGAIEDEERFGTPYKIPTEPANSPYFDPGFEEWTIWRGGIPLITNDIYEEALEEIEERFVYTQPELSVRSGLQKREIRRSSTDLVRISGYREFYSPLNADGLHDEVQDMAWSRLADVRRKVLKSDLVYSAK